MLLTIAAVAGCGGGENGQTAEVPPPPALNTDDTAKVTAQADGSVLRYEMRRLNGRREDLAKYRGKVVLVVNTARSAASPRSSRGFRTSTSPPRPGSRAARLPLQRLRRPGAAVQPGDRGLLRGELRRDFPIFGKTTVVGDDAPPLFVELGAPDWNFNKYLLDRRGRLLREVGREHNADDPELVDRIDELLSSRT